MTALRGSKLLPLDMQEADSRLSWTALSRSHAPPRGFLGRGREGNVGFPGLGRHDP